MHAALKTLVQQYAAPTLADAGFVKAGTRRFMLGAAPENYVMMEIHPYQDHPERAGFFLEWSIVPSAVCGFYNDGRAKAAKPALHWGIYFARVLAPEQIASPSNLRGDKEHWSFAIDGGLGLCGSVLVNLLTSGGLLEELSRYRNREYTLKKFEEKVLKFEMPVSTPFGWPWRYLAMFIEDGDIDLLSEYLTQIEGAGKTHLMLPWFRRRIAERLAAVVE